MCGIFGYVGEKKKNLSTILLSGLSKLEYRGYDSSGIALFVGSKLKVTKEVGQLKNLKIRLKGKKYSGSIGVGHTRWATHGGVTKKNAHPHVDCKKEIVIVHNGIIENYESLKKNLIRSGHEFKSQTDTEVFPHLIEEKLKKNKNLSFEEAVRKSFNEITGLNAVVALNKDCLVAYKKGSPLVAGVVSEGIFVSSDIPTISSLTQDIILIDDGWGVVVRDSSVTLVEAKSAKVKKPRITKFNIKQEVLDKAGYEHFMLKEIYEQPEVVAKVAANNKKDVQKATLMIRKAFGTYFTACGTAAYSGIAATYWFSEIAAKHVNFSVASEFVYFSDFLVPKSLLIAASQSGETMDTLEAVRAAKVHKSKVLALVNVANSSLSRLADYSIYLNAGHEHAVVSTKAYVAKLATFLLFAYSLKAKYKKGTDILTKTAREMRKMMNNKFEKNIKNLAKKLKDQEHIYVIGRGVNYATALEGALKIKEASYIHAEGFAGGELKHGVIALIKNKTPCIVVVANDDAKESVLSNAMELKARGGYIVGISPKKEEVFDYWVKVPDVEAASPLVGVVPMQLLGYFLAVLKGYNPDRPRNLAKSVTVK
ncbi:glutamine--fructose-6-phosphate transaminase (isomerizing) [Patescibacteria group bacterium]